jgi:hypothetical protein
MALHLTPEEHNADPPSKWTVHKSGRRWRLLSSTGGVINTYGTKRDAEKAKTVGPYFDLYQKEGQWFRGEPVPGWKPYTTHK